MRFDSPGRLVGLNFSHPPPAGELAYSITTCSTWFPPYSLADTRLVLFVFVALCGLPLPRYIPPVGESE